LRVAVAVDSTMQALVVPLVVLAASGAAGAEDLLVIQVAQAQEVQVD